MQALFGEQSIKQSRIGIGWGGGEIWGNLRGVSEVVYLSLFQDGLGGRGEKEKSFRPAPNPARAPPKKAHQPRTRNHRNPGRGTHEKTHRRGTHENTHQVRPRYLGLGTLRYPDTEQS